MPDSASLAPGFDPNAVRVAMIGDGTMTYLVDGPVDSLPAVRGRDLTAAWDAAREEAIAMSWGVIRMFRFRRADGSFRDLAFADADACCWAGAVERTVGMRTRYGLSLCLRLLALIDLLGRVARLRSLFALRRDGAELHPDLIRAAAVTPLTEDARFDETDFCHNLRRPPAVGFEFSGASA